MLCSYQRLFAVSAQLFQKIQPMTTRPAIHDQGARPARRSPLFFRLVLTFGLAALLSFRLTWEFKSPVGQWVTVACCALTAATSLQLWRERRRALGGAFSAQGIGRLALFTAGLWLAALSGVTLWLAHNRAEGLVHPQRALPDCLPEAAGLIGYETVSFRSSDGLRLYGWHAPSRNSAAVILVHGHAGNRCGLLPEAAWLAAQGYGVLFYDSRNSGESEGALSTFGLLEVNDVRGAVDFIAARPGVDPRRIGLLGHSQGGGTVILAGARIPQVSAVAAESAYTSLEDNISSGVEQLTGLPPFPFAPLVVFFAQQATGMDITQVRPVDEIASISPRPLLLVHGEQDETILVANAYRLYAAAQEPKELYIVPNAGHCCFPEIGAAPYRQRLLDFFRRALLEP